MKAIESIIGAAQQILAAVLLVIGAGLIALAFLTSPVEVQTAAGLGGLGFLALALLQVKHIRDRKRDEERLERILAALGEIQEKLSEEPEKPRTAIADVLASGLKLYADRLGKRDKEE